MRKVKLVPTFQAVPSVKRGLSFYHIFSYPINSYQIMDTKMMDTLFQFNKLNEKKATQPRKGRGRVKRFKAYHILCLIINLALK